MSHLAEAPKMFLVCKYCRGKFVDSAALKLHKYTFHLDDIAERRERLALEEVGGGGSPPKAIKVEIDGSDMSEIKFSPLELPKYSVPMSVWYQCPECQILLDDKAKFLNHQEAHREDNLSAAVFQIANGEMVTINMITGPDIFLPKISLVPVESSCLKYEVQIYQPAVRIVKDPSLEAIQPERSKRRRTKRYAEFSEDTADNAKDEDFREPTDDELNEDEEFSLSPIRRKRGIDAPRTLEYNQPCTHCHMKFKTAEALEYHLQYHKKKEEASKTRKFRCTICSAGFSRKPELRKHLVGVHSLLPNNPFICTICQHHSPSRGYLWRHLRSHVADSNNVKKPGRGIHFYKKKLTLQDLIVQVYEGDEEGCKTSLEAASKVNVNVGSNLSSGPLGSILSRIAGKMAENNKNRQVKVEKDQPIPVSPLDFVQLNPAYTKGEGSRSMSTYTRTGTPNAFPCKHCVASYPRSHILDSHMKNAHPAEYAQQMTATRLTLICGLCGFQSQEPEVLANHATVSHPELNTPSFPCSLCGSKFPNIIQLDRHKDIVHNAGNKIHACSVCSKKYATPEHKEKHEKKYCLNRPEDLSLLKCKECGVQKNNWTLFRLHLKVHDKNRKLHPCVHCNEQLSTSFNLRRHIYVVHGGGQYNGNKNRPAERPYPPPTLEDQLFL